MLKNYPYRDQDTGGTGGPVNRESLRIVNEQNDLLNQILGKEENRTAAQKEFAALNKDITKQIQDQIKLKELDEALGTKTVRQREEIIKNIALAKLAQRSLTKEMEASINLGEEEKKLGAEKIALAQDLQKELDQELKMRGKIDKKMGLMDNIANFIKDLPGIGKATEKTIDSIIEGQEQAIAKDESRVEAFARDLKEPLEEFAISLGANLALIGTSLMTLFKQVNEVQNQFGISSLEASKLGIKAADSINLIGINSQDAREALVNINQELGIAATSLRSDIVGEMALLAKFTGMSAKSQANFALQAQISGQNAEVLTDETRAAVLQVERELGIRQDINRVLDEAGQITGQIRANLGFSLQNIASAISVTKSFGTSLSEVAGIGRSLLDFQTSISNELEAEIFLCKSLNLERARLFALTGNYEALTKEIAANAGSALDFAKLNVIEQDKIATALGMTSDALADQLFKREGLKKLAQEARDMGDKETAQMLERRDLQQQFNDIVVQLKQLFVDTMTVFLPLADAFAKLLQNSEGFRSFLKGLAGVGFALIIGNIVRLTLAMLGLKGAVAGPVGVIAAIAAGYSLLNMIDSIEGAPIGGGGSITAPAIPAGISGANNNSQAGTSKLEGQMETLIAVSRNNRTLTADKFAQRSIYSDGKSGQTSFS